MKEPTPFSASRFKSRRIAVGLTTVEMARRAGVSQSHLWFCENKVVDRRRGKVIKPSARVTREWDRALKLAERAAERNG